VGGGRSRVRCVATRMVCPRTLWCDALKTSAAPSIAAECRPSEMGQQETSIEIGEGNLHRARHCVPIYSVGTCAAIL
jgi:hypothetical protein